MARRKKITRTQKIINWFDDHHRLMWLCIALLLLSVYLLIHAYRGWADTRRLHASRAAIDTIYSDVSAKLGQPDDLRATNTCTKQSSLGQDYILCSVETDFIYGSANQDQANILMAQIQKVVASAHVFKATSKPAASLSNDPVVDSFAHDATDTYRGPYGSACNVKYSFATPDEVDLSLRSNLQPFEVFITCAHRSVRAIYPSAI